MEAPKYEAPPPDPQFMALQTRAKEQDTEAIAAGLRRDSASLMARYGTMLAMGNAGIPAVTPSTPGATPLLRPGRAA